MPITAIFYTVFMINLVKSYTNDETWSQLAKFKDKYEVC